MKVAKGFALALPLVVLGADAAGADGALPTPVKSCVDIHAYVGADNSMSMDDFRKLMTAAGIDLSQGGGKALDSQCQLTAMVKKVVFVQPVLKKDDGVVVTVTARVTNDNGVCRLVDLSIDGC